MNLGFVFTNYNNSHFTRNAVESILSKKGESSSYIAIVDNKSNDADIDDLKKIKLDFPEVELILNEQNVGYFKGLNIGIAHLRNTIKELSYIVIGNNDLVFPADFIESIKRKADIFGMYPVVSPDIITLDGFHQNPHVVNKISNVREFIYDVYYTNYHLAVIINYLAKISKRFTDRDDETQFEIAQPIYQGYGACYILGPLFFSFFDQLWAPSFLMGEELFLSKQLASKGLKLFYEPSIKVSHHDHATVSKLPSKEFWKISQKSHKIYREYLKLN